MSTKTAMAVAYVAQDHGAEGTSLGTIGTRQCDIDQLLRKRPSKATHLLFVYCSRPLWLLALPVSDEKRRRLLGRGTVSDAPQSRDRVTTDRRDAGQLARLARSGARTAVSVPQVDEKPCATHAGPVKRPSAISRTPRSVSQPSVRRHALRDRGRATWGPAHLRWLSAVLCPPPAQHIVLPSIGSVP